MLLLLAVAAAGCSASVDGDSALHPCVQDPQGTLEIRVPDQAPAETPVRAVVVAASDATCSVPLVSQTLEFTVRSAASGAATASASIDMDMAPDAAVEPGEEETLAEVPFTAPAEPGEYRIEARLSQLGWSGTATMVVV